MVKKGRILSAILVFIIITQTFLGQYISANAEIINHQIPSAPSNLSSHSQTETPVKAVDKIGNISGLSNETFGNILPDTQAPTSPQNLAVIDKSDSTISLAWDPSEDNVKVAGYIVYNFTTPVSTSSAITCTLYNLPQGTNFNLNVKAIDEANNLSDASNSISVTTDELQDKIINSDSTSTEEINYRIPSAPSNLLSQSQTETSVDLRWDASQAENGVKEYVIYKGTGQIGKCENTYFQVNDLLPGTEYVFSVKAVDNIGNVSDASHEISVKTIPDTQAPTAPKNLMVVNKSNSSITLSWDPSEDNVKVSGYIIYNYSIPVCTSSAISCTLDNLTQGTIFNLNVKAIDTANNLSDASNNVSVTTDEFLDEIITSNVILTKDTVYSNLYIKSGTLTLNGYKLTVTGNLIQSGGTLSVSGGRLEVGGDYRLQSESKASDGTITYGSSSGTLKMTNDQDYVTVQGSFVTQSGYTNSSNLSNGILEVKGDFIQKSNSSSYYFIAGGSHKVILSGTGLQKVTMEYAGSKFNILELKNYSSEGVKFTTELNAVTFISNDCRVTFPGSGVMGWTLSEDQVYEGDLYLSGDVLDLNGHKLTVNGRLIQSGGTVYVNGGQLTVTEDYRLQTEKKATDGSPAYSQSNGYLKMTNAADYVQVGGNFVTQSQYSHEGYLSAGTLEVKGNFSQMSSTYNFKTSGAHKVILSGENLQTVSFNNPSSSNSYFRILEITNKSDQGVKFTTNTVVTGEIKDTVTPLTDSKNLILAGTAAVSWDVWRHDLCISETRTLQKDLTIQGSLYITGGTLTLNGYKLTVTGNLIQSGGTLSISGGRLDIGGDYRLQSESKASDGTITYGSSSGTLKMTNDQDYVAVQGSFIAQSGYTISGYLSNGILEVKGDFIQKSNSSSYSFTAGGSHKVILSGTGLQKVTMEYAGSKFNILELKNYSSEGVKFTTELNAVTFISNNCRVTFPGSGVMGWTLSEDQVYEGDLYLSGDVLDLNGHKLTVNGRLIQSGGTVYVNGGQLTVTEDYRLQTEKKATDGSPAYSQSNGYLKMTNAADYVQVGGNFVTQSQYSHEGYLSAGTLEVKGNFSQMSSTYNFKTSGAHKVILSGENLQTVSFNNPSSSNSYFRILEITNKSDQGVKFTTNTVVTGEIKDTVTPLTDSKNLILAGTAAVSWDVWRHDLCINETRTLQKDLTIQGSLYINGGPVNLNGYKLTITGNLIHSGGTLAISGGRLDVGGDYRLQYESKASDGTTTYGSSSGTLKMTNAQDYVTVQGSFVTQSGYTNSSNLSNGILEVKGDFIQKSNSSSYYFIPGGTHKVILSGTGLQKVTMEYAGSKFNILELKNYSSDGVKFTTELNAVTFISNNCRVTFPGSGVMGWTLSEDQVYEGDLYLSGDVLDLNGHKLMVNGRLIQSGGTVYINGGQLVVAEDYRLQKESIANGITSYLYSNGYLKMTNAADYVQVGGGFITQSQYSHEGYLSAGTLEVKGNFSQMSSTYNFKTSAAHKVILSGENLQTVSFNNPSSSNSNFGILEITNKSAQGVKFATNTVVTGEIKDTVTPLIDSKNLILAGTAAVNWDVWRHDLCINETRTLQKDLTIQGSLYINGGPVNLNGYKLTITGNLIHSGGTLAISGGRLDVGGDYRLQYESKASDGTTTYGSSSGTLKMTNAQDYVTVQGSFVTQSGYTNSSNLSNGILEVKGDFIQKSNSSSYYFTAGGSNKVILSGTGLQKVTMEYAGSKFNILELKNYSSDGVKFTTELNAVTFISNNCRVTFPGSGVMGWTLSEDQVYEGDLYLSGDVLDLNGHRLMVNGRLIQSGGTVYINGGQLVVAEDYRLQKESIANGITSYLYSNGYLKMTNAADYVQVGGGFITQSQYSHEGYLSAGTLEVKGNFSQMSSTYNFKTSAAHKVILSGENLQTVSFNNPSSSNSNFGILEITNKSAQGVKFATNTVVTGEIKDTVTPLIDSKNLILAGTAAVNWDVWRHDLCINETRTLQKDLTIQGSLYINGGPVNLNGYKLTITGNLIHSGGTLAISGGRLDVGGDYRLQYESKASDGTTTYGSSSGTLKMTNAQDYVTVQGSFVTQSGYTNSSNLSNGILEVKGDFIQKSNSSSYYFIPGGTHKVILSGTGLQKVTMEYAGSKFNILELKNYSSEGVKFTTELNAVTFISNDCRVTFPGSGVMGWTLSEDQVYEGDLYLSGDVLDLNGHRLTVDGRLIQSGGTVYVNGGQLIVTGDYRLQTEKKAADGSPAYSQSNGYLKMTNAADYVQVDGNFVTQSQYSHEGYLSAGTLEVKGNFSQMSSTYNFKTSAAHKVILSGENLQTVSFNNPSSSNSNFGILEITNKSAQGVKFATNTVVTGEIKDTVTPLIDSKNLILAGMAAVNWDVWRHDLCINETRTLQKDLTIQGSLYINGGPVNLNGYKLTITGNLIHSGGTLAISGGRLDVGGDYRLQYESKASDGTTTYGSSSGTLKMTNAQDYVTVQGSFVTQSGYTNSSNLSNGILEVKGDFIQKSNSSSYYFTAGGSHKVILSGTGLQKVTMEYVGSKFNILELKNYSSDGVKFTTELNAVTFISNDCRVTFPGSGVMGWTLSEDQVYEGDLYLSGDVLDLNGHRLTVDGRLIQSGGTVYVNGGQLIVTGDYRLQTEKKAADGSPAYSQSNGYLKMTNAADYVQVDGNFVTQSQYSHEGYLSAGTLEVKGNFSQMSSTYNFKTSAAHKVILSGENLQTVSFNNPSSSNSNFGILEITNKSAQGVKFATNTVVTGEIKDTVTPLIDSKNLILAGTAAVNWDVWRHDLCINETRTLQKDLTIQGSLYINGGPVNLNGYKLTITGNLIHSGGTLAISGGRLDVGGDYRLQYESKASDGTTTYGSSSGTLKMTNAQDYVTVQGSFVTQSGYTNSSNLSNGILEVKGDFIQKSNSSSYYFIAGGSHKVILSGTGLQKVTMEYAGSKFNILELKNYSFEGVKFTTELNAITFISNNCRVTFPGSGVMGWTLSEDQVYDGDLYLSGDVLDLNGHKLTVNGRLIQSGGTVYINGGQLMVMGDYRLQKESIINGITSYSYSNGYLKMTNDSDYLQVGGSFITQAQYSHASLLTAGTFAIMGDFAQKNYSSGENFRATGTNKVILCGEGKQSVSFDNPSKTTSCFSTLLINNSSAEGVVFGTKTFVTMALSNSLSKLSNSKNITLSNTAEILEGTWYDDISMEDGRVLDSNLTIAGSLYLGGSGTYNLNGKMLKAGKNLIISRGTLYINKGQLFVTGDLRIQSESISSGGIITYGSSDGYLRMINTEDYIYVGGSFITQAYYSHSGYLTAGIIEVKGDFRQVKNSSSANFLASGTHKVLLNGSNVQKVEFANPGSSKFNILGITKPIETGYNFNTTAGLWNLLVEEIKDTEAPSKPDSLNKVKAAYTVIEFSWTASTDNEAVIGYEIYRDGNLVGIANKSNYSDLNLLPDMIYTYTVKAFDAVHNLSEESEALSISTIKDTLAPSVPALLVITSRTSDSVKLSWMGSNDNVKVSGYAIFRNEVRIKTVNGTSYTDTNLLPDIYSYYVKAEDISNNTSEASNTVIYDNKAPDMPEVPEVTDRTVTSISIKWKPANDNKAVGGYLVFRNGTKIGNVTSTEYVDTGLVPSLEYFYFIKAYDLDGNLSNESDIVRVSTPDDTEAPSVPKNLRISSKAGTSVTIAWDKSSDNYKVSGYEIYRNGIKIGTTTENSYKDTGLVPGTSYSYKVCAFDIAGNVSLSTNEISGMPMNPIIKYIDPLGGTTIGGATKRTTRVYVVNNNNSANSMATFEYSSNGSAWTKFNMSGPYIYDSSMWYFQYSWDISSISSDTYTVRYTVYDAENNMAQTTDQYIVDRTAPEAPKNFNAVQDSGKINLSWTMAVDADVINYTIFRSTDPAKDFVQIAQINGRNTLNYSDMNVQAEVRYYYKICATDCYNQTGTMSNTVDCTALADTTLPVVMGIYPADGSTIGPNTNITVKAEDNIMLSEIKLQYSENNGETWFDIGKVSTKNTASFKWNISGINSLVKIRAIAKDNAGNESDGSKVYSYIIDTQGPSKITGVTPVAYSNSILLNWNDVPDQDFSYFQVETLDTYTGLFNKTGTVNNKRGIQVTNLKCSRLYTFRIVAYDIYGNRGVESDIIEVTTLPDSTPPSIVKITPGANSYSGVIKISATATDNSEIKTLKLQISKDGLSWRDLTESSPGTAAASATITFSLNVADYEDGIYRVRAVAEDLAGNISNTQNSSYVEYNFDRTPPSKPTGIKSTPATAYINLTWQKGAEPDLSAYKIYRSESKEGSFTVLNSSLTALAYNDRNVKPGTTYYYKISAIDFAGNESETSEVISVQPAADNEKPEVLSVYPNAGFTLPANPKINVLANDNYKLSYISLEYLDANNQWALIGKQMLNTYSEVASFKWNTNELNEGNYKLRALAEDQNGNKSEYRQMEYQLNLNPPSKPVLTVEPAAWSNNLSWTPSTGAWTEDEQEFAGFMIFRKTSDNSSYTLLKETTSSTYTDKSVTPGIVYSYKVEAIDIYRNSSSSNEVMASPLDIDTVPPVAEAGSDQTASVGIEIVLDGTKSKDNNRISKYLWDFGDGANSSQAQPRHIYSTEGEYIVNLTVTDMAGNSSSDTLKVTVKDPNRVGTYEIVLYDSTSGSYLSGAEVLVLKPDGTTQKLYSDSIGVAKITGDLGTYRTAVYKNGYKPKAIDVEITAGGVTGSKYALEKGEIVIGSLTVKRMTLEEIEAAGIDVRAPENQFVYKYDVRLKFFETDVAFAHYVNGSGLIYDWKPYRINDSVVYPGTIKPGGPTYDNETRPIITYMVMPGGASWLKEFFEIKLVAENTAEVQFVLTDSSAELKLPEGLTFIPTESSQSKTVSLGSLAGGQSTSVKWVVRGDKTGEYSVDAEFKGTLMPFKVPITTIFKSETFKVWGSDAINLIVQPEDFAYENTPYKIRVGLKNVSDIKVYNVSLVMKEDSRYIFTAKDGNIKTAGVINAGETIWLDFEVIPTFTGLFAGAETLLNYVSDPGSLLKTQIIAVPAPLYIEAGCGYISGSITDSSNTAKVSVRIKNKKSYDARNVKATLYFDHLDGVILKDKPQTIEIGDISANSEIDVFWNLDLKYLQAPEKYNFTVTVAADNEGTAIANLSYETYKIEPNPRINATPAQNSISWEIFEAMNKQFRVINSKTGKEISSVTNISSNNFKFISGGADNPLEADTEYIGQIISEGNIVYELKVHIQGTGDGETGTKPPKEQAEEIWLYLEMIQDYQAIIDAPAATLMNEELPTLEAINEYKLNLRHVIQFLQIKLLEIPLVKSNSEVSKYLAQNVIDGNGINMLDDTLIRASLRERNSVIDEVFGEYVKKVWLECTSLLLNLVPIVGSAKAIAEGIVGHDLLTGRQFAWWERAFNIGMGSVSLVGEVGLLAVTMKDARLATKLSEIATIAGNSTVKAMAEAISKVKSAITTNVKELFVNAKKIFTYTDAYEFETFEGLKFRVPKSEIPSSTFSEIDDIALKMARESFNKSADPFRSVLGSGRTASPAEWNDIISRVEQAGGKVKLSTEGTMGYSPASKGIPGEITIDPDASLSALKHEYQHFLDDMADGWPGWETLWDFQKRSIRELRAYMGEIREAENLGLSDVANQLWENYLAERKYIIDNYGPLPQ